jgi:hypothetical protein
MFEQTFKNLDDVLWKEQGCGSELLGGVPMIKETFVGFQWRLYESEDSE